MLSKIKIVFSGEMKTLSNNDNTFTIEYTPKTHGNYKFTVKFDGDHIPGSPFNVNILVNPCKLLE